MNFGTYKNTKKEVEFRETTQAEVKTNCECKMNAIMGTQGQSVMLQAE